MIQLISNELLSIEPEAVKYALESCILNLIKKIPSEKLREIFDIDIVDENVAYERSNSVDLSLNERLYWENVLYRLRNSHYSEITVKLK